MKRILSLLCLLLTCASFVAAQDGSINNDSSWQRYTVKGDDFSVRLPLLPAMTTTDVYRTPFERLRRERRLAVYADGVVFTVYTLDNNGHAEMALKDSLEAMRSGPGWDPKSEKDLTGEGFAGKQYYSLSVVGGTAQVFATKKRFYRFQVFGAPPDDPRVKPFFASIILGKKGEGTEVSDGQGTAYEHGSQARTPISNEKLYTGKEVDRKALLVMKVEPAYTEEARAKQITGTVVFKVVFSPNGSVTNIRTVSGLPSGLTEQAIDAARKIKFIPAMKDGKFVPMWMQLEYNFNLY